MSGFLPWVPTCATCDEVVPVDHRGAPRPVHAPGRYSPDFCSEACVEEYVDSCEELARERWTEANLFARRES